LTSTRGKTDLKTFGHIPRASTIGEYIGLQFRLVDFGTLPVVLTQPDARGELLPILLPITALMPFSVPPEIADAISDT